MSAPPRPDQRPWEPEALELPLDRRPRPPTHPPPWLDGDPDDARRSGDRERPGSHVVVIDIA
jgi:hypothetical protein